MFEVGTRGLKRGSSLRVSSPSGQYLEPAELQACIYPPPRAHLLPSPTVGLHVDTQ